MRICSLLPGATEVVAALGLADHLVGVSHECDYPPEVREKPVLIEGLIDAEDTSSPEIDRQVGQALEARQSLYRLDTRRFLQADPDLVITQDLCQVCAVTPDELQQALGTLPRPPQLLTLNATTLEDVFHDIDRIGSATGRAAQSRELVDTLRARLKTLKERSASLTHRPRVLCLEWLAPFYVAGHWVPEMVEWAGGQAVLAKAGAASELVTWDRIVAAKPEVLILMPCGFSLRRTLRELDHLAARPEWARDWQALPAVRQGQVFAVDATSYFSRPGPRLIDGVALLAALCHPSQVGSHIPEGASPVNLGACRAS
jgi:iron complex transport system substrate-binding protein